MNGGRYKPDGSRNLDPDRIDGPPLPLEQRSMLWKILYGAREPVNPLEQARRREHGLTSKELYPPRPGEWKAAIPRATAKKEPDR